MLHFPLVKLSLLYCCILVLAYSKWHAWHGAWYWGPRFLLPLSVFGSLYFALLTKFWICGKAWNKIVLLFFAVVSFMIYKVGVGVGQGPLIACLEASSNSENCYWQWGFTPFSSWVNMNDFVLMLSDRSTVVELASALLAVLLLCFAPGSPPCSASRKNVRI